MLEQVEIAGVVSSFTTSEQIGELAGALALAHKEFKPVLKDASNPFFKSKYADLAGVIESTSEGLSKNGLVVIQSPRLTDNRIAVTTLLAHSSGQWLRDELQLPLSKFDAQGAGSAITYARRYAYQAIVGVAAEDDDGNAASPQTFKKQEDGSFAKGTNTPNPSSTVTGKSPSTETVQKPKPVARKAAKPVPDEHKNWGGLAGQPKATDFPFGENNSTPAGITPASNAITPENPITDADVIFPGDEAKPADDRLPNDAERKDFMNRLLALKAKGYEGMREYLLKEAGVQITNDIPYGKMKTLVARLEDAHEAGGLKTLLGGK